MLMASLRTIGLFGGVALVFAGGWQLGGRRPRLGYPLALVGFAIMLFTVLTP